MPIVENVQADARGEMDRPRQELAYLARVAFRVAGRLGLGREDAEDLQQSVLLDYLTTRQEIAHQEAWIRVVARRKALRARYAASEIRGDREPRLSLHPGALEHFEPDAVTHIELSRLFERMRPGDRTLWWRRRVLGMPICELEELHGASASTLKRRLRRIDRSLRRRVDPSAPRSRGTAASG